MTETMQSSLTTLRVLELVGERQPVAVGEVARLIDRPKSSVQRALQTLHQAGWIRPEGSDRTRWLLTTRVATVARAVGNEIGLRDAAGPILRRLRDETRESVSLYVLEGDETVLVDFYEGRHTIRFVSPIGVRLPLHAGSASRAILAHLPDDVRERILRAPLAAFTAGTVVDPRRLLEELDRIRRRGYGVSSGEVTEDAAGVGAVIRDPRGRPIASAAVLLPAGRAGADEVARIGHLVAEATAAIELALTRGN